MNACTFFSQLMEHSVSTAEEKNEQHCIELSTSPRALHVVHQVERSMFVPTPLWPILTLSDSVWLLFFEFITLIYWSFEYILLHAYLFVVVCFVFNSRDLNLLGFLRVDI